MKVIILGAGQLGIYLTKKLFTEYDVSVIDINEERLKYIANTVDVQTVFGNATKPSILIDAGIKDADMILAVTASDEINISACDIAYKLYKTPIKIARIRELEYTRFSKLLNNIDVVLKPFALMTEMLEQLTYLPGAFSICNFFDNTTQLIGTKISKDSSLIGNSIKDIYLEADNAHMNIIDVYRSSESLNLDNERVVIKDNDNILFLSEKEYSAQLLSIFQPRRVNIKKVFIAGANDAGIMLTKELESQNINVKLIDPSIEKCDRATKQLQTSIVLNNNPVNNDLLIAQSVDEADIFFALTNHDEINIMSSILAKKLGAKKTIAMVNNSEYFSIINDMKLIDLAISPHIASYSLIKSHLAQIEFKNLYNILDRNNYVCEIVIHGDKTISSMVGKQINSIKLPYNSKVIGLMRDKEIIFSPSHQIVEDEDHLLIITANEEELKAIEKTFQVMPLYIY